MLGGLLTLVGSAVYLARAENRAEVVQIGTDLTKKFRLLIAKWRRTQMRVLIVGGKTQGQSIANRLLAKDEVRVMFRSAEHQITFIEEDKALCEEIERRFNTPIFQGDGTKKELLEQVGTENIDVVIAASEDDGRNVIVALQARQMGLEQVIAIVQDPEYAQLLEQNDVVAISAPWTTAAMVESLLDRPGLSQLFEFGIGAASVLDVIVPGGSNVGGRPIRELDVPEECVIAAIIRDNKFVVPRGGTIIEEEDQVYFIGPAAAIRDACDMFIRQN